MEELSQTYVDLELCEKLASGGMAEVFRAKQLGVGGFEKTVAVKRILPHFAAHKEFRQMFQFEMNLCARLQHPNIVQVYKNGEYQDYVYLVMEYVQGKNVRHLFECARKKNAEIPIEVVCYVISESAKGLDYAHSFVDDTTNKNLGIIHRDISPQNIMLSYDGQVKIVDFGVAKVTSAADMTKTGVLKGKFSYMSPEQVKGQKIDARSDIFSLGIVFFELLTKERLFSSGDDIKILSMIRECSIPDVQALNPNVDDELAGILHGMLSKKPDNRISSTKDLFRSLNSYLNKNYPDFIPMDLSDFLKDIFKDVIDEEKNRKSVSEGSIAVGESISRSVRVGSGSSRPVLSYSGSRSVLVASEPFWRSPVKIGIAIFALVFVIAVSVSLTVLLKRSNTTMTTFRASPTEISGLRAWFNPDSIPAGENDSLVGLWQGASEKAFTSSQKKPEHQPKLVLNRINGRSVLKFDGKDDYLEADDLAKSLQSASAITVFYVARANVDKTHYVWAINSEPKEGTVVRAGFTGGHRLRLKTDTSSNQYFDSKKAKVKEFSVYTAIYKPKFVSLYQNGYLRILNKSSRPIKFSKSAYFTIGQEWDFDGPSDFLNGEVAEIIIYDRAVVSTERQALENYLGEKYNIKIKN